jgi:sulfur relay (sulfurtransferase) complex TusBCD TusD component (DsrE family)
VLKKLTLWRTFTLKTTLAVGILLTTSPEHQNTHTVCQLADALLSAGHTVDLFLMDDGVYNLLSAPKASTAVPLLQAAQSKGMKIALCTQSAENRGLSEKTCLPGAEWRSQHALSKMVAGSDRFLTFGS